MASLCVRTELFRVCGMSTCRFLEIFLQHCPVLALEIQRALRWIRVEEAIITFRDLI
jgi:hypothetical protein